MGKFQKLPETVVRDTGFESTLRLYDDCISTPTIGELVRNCSSIALFLDNLGRNASFYSTSFSPLCRLNHSNTALTLASNWLGRAVMLCEASGIRTSAVCTPRCFSDW